MFHFFCNYWQEGTVLEFISKFLDGFVIKTNRVLQYMKFEVISVYYILINVYHLQFQKMALNGLALRWLVVYGTWCLRVRPGSNLIASFLVQYQLFDVHEENSEILQPPRRGFDLQKVENIVPYLWWMSCPCLELLMWFFVHNVCLAIVFIFYEDLFLFLVQHFVLKVAIRICLEHSLIQMASRGLGGPYNEYILFFDDRQKDCMKSNAYY